MMKIMTGGRLDGGAIMTGGRLDGGAIMTGGRLAGGGIMTGGRLGGQDPTEKAAGGLDPIAYEELAGNSGPC